VLSRWRGLPLPATLAERLGIGQAADQLVDLGARPGGAARPGRKLLTLVHAMVAGGDLYRRRGAAALRVYPGSTRTSGDGDLHRGTWRRAFTLGHVRQLDRVCGEILGRSGHRVPGPGSDHLTGRKAVLSTTAENFRPSLTEPRRQRVRCAALTGSCPARSPPMEAAIRARPIEPGAQTQPVLRLLHHRAVWLGVSGGRLRHRTALPGYHLWTAVFGLWEVAGSLRPMSWPWRRTPAPVPVPSADKRSRYNAAALDAFLEQARTAAVWYESRADVFERKASTLLGFVGVILVLLPTLRAPIAKAHGQDVRTLLVVLAIAAAVLLALAALAATMVLMPRPYTAPSVPQLSKEWTAYAKQGQAYLTPEHLTGVFVDQLVKRADPQSSPLETLRRDADKRAKWMKWATWLVFVGVLVLAGLTSTLLAKGGA
jgi:hypothetical protein